MSLNITFYAAKEPDPPVFDWVGADYYRFSDTGTSRVMYDSLNAPIKFSHLLSADERALLTPNGEIRESHLEKYDPVRVKGVLLKSYHLLAELITTTPPSLEYKGIQGILLLIPSPGA